MSLIGRFSTLFLVTLALVLLGFSTALYFAARTYLHRQVAERSASALAVLAAAAEVHPDGVEWEPQERVLPLGLETGAEQLGWMVSDDQGHRVDRSRNLDEAGMTLCQDSRAGVAVGPVRISDARGRAWQVARHRVVPNSTPVSGSLAVSRLHSGTNPPGAGVPEPDDQAKFYPALLFTVLIPLAPLEATLGTLGGALIILGGATWGVAALLCRWLSRRALAPLRTMLQSATGLDAQDPGWSLAQPGTGDELDQLGQAFNDLLARLHLAFERQRRFSGDASHQLRTPLTILIGQVEVAMRRERSGEEYRRVLNSALQQARHLFQIVEALLFLARAEGETHLPACEPIELHEWVAGYLESCPAKESIKLTPPGEGPGSVGIRAHPALLEQLLANLLDNATKYAQTDRSITVNVRREGQSVVLAVEDDGPGIAPEDLDRVFEPFYRSTQARLQGVAGVGLGLAVVRRIAVASGGTALVRVAPGKGCCIDVRFPALGIGNGPSGAKL